jgi:AcrR family transcriptional regulator
MREGVPVRAWRRETGPFILASMSDSPRKAGDDARRCRLLEAALSVFARYGFRKSSMEEVARAAQISRQALYLHFATKEDLFRAAAAQAIERNVGRARGVLADTAQPLETRLVRAYDEWMGRFVELRCAGASDLTETGGRLAGDIIARYEAEFVEAVTAALRGSRLMECYAPAGLEARQLAENLEATARGLKHTCGTREEFVQRIEVAARALCAPLLVGESRVLGANEP